MAESPGINYLDYANFPEPESGYYPGYQPYNSGQPQPYENSYPEQPPQQPMSSYTDPQQPVHYYANPQQPAYPHPQVVPHHQQQRQPKFVVKKNFNFLSTKPGIFTMINIVLLFFSWIVMVSWRGHVGSIFVLVHQKDGSSFFLFATLVPFFLYIAYIIAVVTGFHKRITIVNLHLAVVIHCLVWTILLTAASAVVMRQEENNHCTSANCAVLDTAAAFGFISAFGNIAEGILYFKRWRFQEAVH